MRQLPDMKVAYWYPKPIPMNCEEKELIKICRDKMGIDPAQGKAFLFFDSKKTQIQLFFLDGTSSQKITKLVPKEGFSMSITTRNEKYIQIDGSELQEFFKQ